MMAKNIFGKEDTLRENYIVGAELAGRYDFPVLPSVQVIPENMIPFTEIRQDKQPYRHGVHFFIDDDRFERLWQNPEQYIPNLRNFQCVCGPDFSGYLDMPVSCAIWNTYRSRALSYYLSTHGRCTIIPTAQWMDESSYNWCFDGLPMHSTIAVSTNGCFSPVGRRFYVAGMLEMERRLKPYKILCVGRPLTVSGLKTEVIYYKSFGQRLTEKLTKPEVKNEILETNHETSRDSGQGDVP